ncbi:MAG: tetratricopeptide repeat protein [Deltaproteobacteria bacterium]|nr:tetratricopeptide repeat protein [Deltaproteobacteria bacterium]
MTDIDSKDGNTLKEGNTPALYAIILAVCLISLTPSHSTAEETQPPQQPAVQKIAADQTQTPAQPQTETPKTPEEKPQSQPAPSAVETPEQKEQKEASVNKRLSETIDAFAAGNWVLVIQNVPMIIEAKPNLALKLIPLLAYAHDKTGDKAKALSVLKDSEDTYGALIRAIVTGGKVTLPGFKDEVLGPDLSVVEIGVPATTETDSLVYKKTLSKGLKEAFIKALHREASKGDIETFNERILPLSEKFYLSHFVLSQEDGSGYTTIKAAFFWDATRLKETLDDMNLTGAHDANRLKTVLLTKRGSDTVKKALLQDLMDSGYPVEDIGSGDISPEVSPKLKGSIVIQITENPAVNGKVMGSNFRSIRGSLTFTILNGNNGVVIAKIEKTHTLVHLNEEAGKELALKKAYEKALKPLKETITDIEVRMGRELASGLLPSVEASFADAKEIFSNIYKFYANEPVGTVQVKNNTNNVYRNVKVSFSVKGYMDYPAETVVERLGPKESKSVPVKAVFNNRLLDLTDNTLLQSEVEVSYAEPGGTDKTLKLRQPMQVYEKQALIWDDKGKVASFLTYKDPVVVDFATKSVREFNYPYLNQSIVMARAVFGAMGVLGITYVPDPTPYSAVASVTTMIDRVQYPRQTLARKAGDCDDLVSLLGAALESVGIKVMPIDAPGHLFIMFDTGIPEDNLKEAGFREDMFVKNSGTLWIPFETTLVGQSFFLAWEKGVENYKKWPDKIKPIDLRKSWAVFAPATLPPDEFTQSVSMASIEKKFPGELDNLRKRKVESVMKKGSKETTHDAKKEAILTYGKNGMPDEGLKAANELLKTVKNDPDLYNNAGNLYFMKAEFDAALKSYKEASVLAPDDAGIWINIARAHLRLKQADKASEAFKKALELNPEVKETYLKLQTEIGR